MKLDGFRYLLVVLVLATQTFSQSLNAGDELNQGATAYRRGKYEEAVQHFKNAIALDDHLVNAHLYLATTLASQYIPGGETSDNTQIEQQAIDEYQRVLDLSPENISSIKGLASLYLEMKKFEESKDYNRKAIALDPANPESYYAIAVIDWSQAYQFRQEQRGKLKLIANDPLIDKNECWMVRNENEDRIKDGMDMLNKALSLRPDYDDAMAYLNLLYRERADIQCGDKAAYSADNAIGDDWVDKAFAVRKSRAEKEPRPAESSQPKQ
jgi:tetratricopeptide (TPR) repeat protein